MEELIPITLFLMPVLIVGVIFYFNYRNRREVLETVRQAAQSGTQLTPETIKALGMPQRKKGGEIRTGIVLLSIALAFIVLGWSVVGVSDEPEILRIMTGVASFPGLVGLSLIGMGLFMRDKSSED